MKRRHEVKEPRTNKEARLERRSTTCIRLHCCWASNFSVSSDQPLLRLPWSCVSTWTRIQWCWSGDATGAEGPVGCCPYSRWAGREATRSRSWAVPACPWTGCCFLMPSNYMNFSWAQPWPRKKNWETSFCLNGLAQSIPSPIEKTKRENTNCGYQHWERGHVNFIDTYKKKLSLICCLPSAFPSCVCSLDKGLHQKRKSHQIILFIFLVNKTVQCIKAKTYTTDEWEDQDLFCIRILQGADYGPVLWKIIVSLTTSGTRTMKVKTINRCLLKICESVDSISEMKTDMSLIPSRIACSLCCRLVAKLCPALLRPHGL